MRKVGLVDVGGGFRGIYACAALDRCLEEGVDFDLGIGVSAGSANIASFVACQLGRNYRFYTEYGSRKQYASLRNSFLKQSFIDMDYVYGTLCNEDGEDPIDYDAFIANPMEFLVVAADAETGNVKYFPKSSIEKNAYDAFKASSAIPGICKPYEVDGRLYFDGALGDPVPVQKAFDEGCDKVVVLLTKPKDLIRKPGLDPYLAKAIERKYPNAAEALRHRAENYNQGVDLAKEYEREGRALIVAPEDTCGVSTLTRDRDKLNAFYAEGYKDGEQILEFLS